MKTFHDFKDILTLDWQDKVFLHYTGNMFGIGCNAFSRKAVDRISKLKGREDQRGYIILIPDRSWLTDFGILTDPGIDRLLQQYWPGNLSVIFPDRQNRFSHISLKNNIAVRVPTDLLLREFLKRVKKPIISTSINLRDEPPLITLSAIKIQKEDWFDFALLPELFSDHKPVPSTVIDTSGEEINFLREGSIKFEDLQLSYEQPLILFVCTGNICRSPLAEYSARKLMIEKGLKFRIASAGFLQNNIKISTNSFKILYEQGIDSSLHLSRKLTQAIIGNSWLILTMENIHKEKLQLLEPNAAGRIYTLSEFCGSEFCDPDCDIDDPYGLDIESYRETYLTIEKRIVKLIEILQQEER